MLGYIGPFMVIESGATQSLIVQYESQGMNQMQFAATIGAEAYDIPCIWGYFRLV